MVVSRWAKVTASPLGPWLVSCAMTSSAASRYSSEKVTCLSKATLATRDEQKRIQAAYFDVLGISDEDDQAKQQQTIDKVILRLEELLGNTDLTQLRAKLVKKRHANPAKSGPVKRAIYLKTDARFELVDPFHSLCVRDSVFLHRR